MNFKKIAFLGDSFTWGEGLELYIDNPKWISQRKKQSTWMDLIPLQDDDVKQFREANRFATLVSSHFKSETIIDNRNGGSFRSLMEFIDKILNWQLRPDVVIIQFSSFTRNNIHYHQEVNGICPCEMCKLEHVNATHISFDYINNIIMKSINPSLNLNSILSDSESKILKIIENEFNVHYYYDNMTWLFEYLKKIEYEYSRIHLDFLLSEYLDKLHLRGIPTFFIDTWEHQTSQIIFSNKTIVDNLIPLLGYDGNYYKKYTQWEDTFPYKRIENEFPNTKNGHLTLLQHEYISKSIIEFLEKNSSEIQSKKKIKYI
jgi:hypothetical protein